VWFGLVLSGIGVAAPAASQSVPVLLYHRIGPQEGSIESIPLETFEQQMRYLAEHGYSTVSLSGLLRFMRGGDAPAKPICITFDDGWRSQLLAVPALRRYRLKAAFLLFPERGIEDPYGDYLRWSEVRELADDPNFEIGAHSMTHPWDRTNNLVTWMNGPVPGRGMVEVHHEIEDSKHVLEQALGRPVTVFAWPMGWYNDALLSIAREAGYQGVLAVGAGANQRGDDPFRVKRLIVDGSCTLAQFTELVETHRYPRCASGKMPSISNTP